MKNIKILFVLLCVIFILSCAKKTSWNCSCTVMSGVSTGTVPVYTTTVDNATQANAKDQCNKWGGTKLPANSYTCTVSNQ